MVSVFGDPVPQVVLSNHVFGEVGQFQAHVFISFHGSHEVEVFDIKGHEARSWSGDCAVENEFDGEEIRFWCPAVPGIVHSFSADREVCVIGI